jgi:hypothetical protein
VCASSLRKTAHDVLGSALARVTSSFVPRILKADLAGSMAAKRGTAAVYRLGVGSEVTRSRWSLSAAKVTVDRSAAIFLRKKEAITVVGVW